MRRFRFFLSLLIVLLFASSAFAGPFMVLPKRGSAWSGGGYSAETLAYKARVEADGGTVVDLTAVDAAYALISSQSLNVKAWYSPRFGIASPQLISETFTAGLSFESGKAFITSPSSDLSGYVGRRIQLIDSAGKSAYGWIKAAGTGETYGDELLENADCESTYNWYSGVSLSVVAGGQSGNCFQATYASGTAYILNPADTTAGSLLKLSAYIKSGTSGDESIKLQFGPVTAESPDAYTTQVSTSSWAQMSMYGATARTTTWYGLVKPSTAGNVLYDTVSMKQVLTPSSTGVRIVSTSGGTTYNWAAEDVGFNRNDTYTVYVDGSASLGRASKLYDLSSGNNDIWQPLYSKSPEYKTNIQNGKPSVRFDGTDDFLSCAKYGLSAISFFAVINPSAFKTYTSLYSNEDGAAGSTYLIKSTGKIAIYVGAYGNYDGSGSNTLSTGTCYLSEFTANNATDLNSYINGNLDVATVALRGDFSDTSTEVYGSSIPYSRREFAGDVMEIIVINGIVDATTRQAIEAYLNSAYAIW